MNTKELMERLANTVRGHGIAIKNLSTITSRLAKNSDVVNQFGPVLMEITNTLNRVMPNQNNMNKRLELLEGEMRTLNEQYEALDAHHIAMAGRVVELEHTIERMGARQDPGTHNSLEGSHDYVAERDKV